MTSSNNVMTSINIWNQNLFYNLTLFFLTSLKKSTSLKIITSLCYEKTSNLKAMKLQLVVGDISWCPDIGGYQYIRGYQYISRVGCTYKWSTFEFADFTFQSCLTNKNKTSCEGHWKKIVKCFWHQLQLGTKSVCICLYLCFHA